MKIFHDKRILFLYLSLPIFLILLYSAEFFLAQKDRFDQQALAYDFYNKRIKIEEKELISFEKTMDELLKNYQSCSAEYADMMTDMRYIKPVLTQIYLQESNGEICSNYKKNYTDYTFKKDIGHIQLAHNDNSMAVIKRDVEKDITLFWVISLREFWVFSRFSYHDYITVEYSINGEFFIGIDKNSYYTTPSNNKGKERIEFYYSDQNDHINNPLQLHFYYHPPKGYLLDSNAFIRLFLLFSTYSLLVGVIIFKITHHIRYQIKRGIKNGEFKAHFQPVVNLKTGEWLGAEALIRWYRNGVIYKYPDEFIPYAESNDLSADFCRVCSSDSKKLLEHIPDTVPFFISINIPPTDLNSGSVKEILMKHKTKNSDNRIEIEITERGLSDCGLAKTTKYVNELNIAGLRISLDDFGTGESGLSYINSLPFNKIKIDQSFVSAINTDSINAHLLTTIIDLAKKLNVDLVAEGVETKEQLDWLLAQGIQLGQGWHFERDMSTEDFLAKYKTLQNKTIQE